MLDLKEGRASTIHLVMPNETNPLGTLFGGKALEWMDLAAGFASMRLSGRTTVTASIERVDFKVPVSVGQIVLVDASVRSVGRSSIEVRVDLQVEDLATGKRELCTTGLFHMVALDENGEPTPVERG